MLLEFQIAADQAVEEAELQRHVEQEREREKEFMKIHTKEKRNKKDGGRRSKTKSGTSPGKNPVAESPAPGNIGLLIFNCLSACVTLITNCFHTFAKETSKHRLHINTMRQ